MPPWARNVLLALVPLILAALVTVAWDNSHQLTKLSARLDADEREILFLRNHVAEQR